MPELPRYFAIKSLEKIQPKLPAGQQKLLKELMAMLDDGGAVNALALREALFPMAGEKSANTMLRRLLDNINAAATELGMVFRAETTADKKAGVNRRIWFEGAAEPATRPYTGDLNGIPEALRESGQRGMILGGPVVLMTFNAQETKALLEAFTSGGSAPEEVRDGHTYTRLGIYGNVEVVHVLSRQGRSEAQATAEAVIKAWRPAAIIPVGVAFGMHPAKQHIGDVLVAEYLRDYELARVNPDASQTPRGNRPQATDALIARIRHLDTVNRDQPHWPNIDLGVLMSGDKLVDNRPFRDALLKVEAEAIGGEMEGIGVETAARKAGVAWIVIKGICDWADGGKNTGSKAADQLLAARNAVRVVKTLLETPDLFTSPERTTPKLYPAQPPVQPGHGLTVPAARWMGMGDCCNLPDGHLQKDAKGVPARLDGKAATVGAQESGDSPGVGVLSYLHEWIADPDAPPLFALLGEYGMGKTVTAQQLALELDAARESDPTQPIPLYFDLRHVTQLGKRVPSLAEALEECMARGWLDDGHAAGYLPANVHRWIAQGAVVIFDGLDEVLVKLTEADGQVFTNGLLKLIADARARARAEGRALRLKVLISCRTQYFPTLQAQNSYFTQSERGEFTPDTYRALVLLPWGEEQVRRYLATALPGMDIDRVQAMVESVHNLKELTHRPYTLKLVAEFIPDIECERAAGRTVYGVTLYRKMAEKWLARDSGKHHIRPEHKLRLAAHLAAHLWRTKRTALPAADLNGWFHQWRDSEPELRLRYASLHPDQLEEDLRTATFLSRSDDGDKSAFRFAHTSLQEFFLASYLLQAIRDKQPARWAMGVPSRETLDFLGQLLAEAADPGLLQSLQGWRRQYAPQTSELLLAYALQARARGWPVPILHGIDLNGASLRGWEIKGGAGAPLDLGPANFSGADLRDAVLQHLRLTGARFDDARLGGANLLDCDAAASRFDGAELTAAIFRNCALESSSWENAHGYRTQWLLCRPDTAAWEDGMEREAGLDKALLPQNFPMERGHLAWLDGHTGGVTSCAWSPDGHQLASAGGDGTLRLWDAASGEALQVLMGHTNEVWSCTWSPDGRQLASAGRDGSVRLWDVVSGTALKVLESHSGRVMTCVWSPDGSQLASAGDDGIVRLWDSASGAPLRALEGHTNGVMSCAWSRDGCQLASAGGDGVRLWDVVGGESLQVLEGHLGSVTSCSWSPDGHQLASAEVEGLVRLWDVTSGDILRVLDGHSGSVTSCAWSPDGRQLASAGQDGMLRLWDADSGEALWMSEGHSGLVISCDWSPDGRQLVSAGFDGTVRRWDSASGEVLQVLESHTGNVMSCDWSPNGRQLASAGDEGTVLLWDASSGEALRVLKGYSGGVRTCVWSPDGRQLALGEDNGKVRIWDAASGEVLRVLEGHTNEIWSCCWSPDGRQLASTGDYGKVRIWDAASGEVLRVLNGHTVRVMTCAWSPDGRHLASAGFDGKVRLWDVESDEALQVLNVQSGSVMSCAWSPDGRQLASAGLDSLVRLWDAASGAPLRVLDGHTDGVRFCAWSPDGRQLASAGFDGMVRLWDTASGETLRVLKGHFGGVWSCAWSPDGRQLISAGLDGMLRLWDATSGELLRVHAFCLHKGSAGHAVWQPHNDRIIEVAGEAWRYLSWQDRDAEGRTMRLPLEIFGPVPGSARLQGGAG